MNEKEQYILAELEAIRNRMLTGTATQKDIRIFLSYVDRVNKLAIKANKLKEVLKDICHHEGGNRLNYKEITQIAEKALEND